MKPDTMESYLSQNTCLDMTLGEFAEIVFIEGFVAGEKYARSLVLGNSEREPRLN